MASVTLDTTLFNNSANEPIILSFTVGNNPNRYLTVMLMSYLLPASDTITVTYNGVSMTENTSLRVIDTTSGTSAVRVWELIAPDTGTHDISIDVASVTRAMRVGVASFYNVDQSIPSGNYQTQTDASNPSLTVTTSTDMYALDAFSGNSASSKTITVGGGQTAIGSQNFNDGTRWIQSGASYEPGGSSSTVMSWTVNMGDGGAHAAWAVLPASASSGNFFMLL